MKKLVLWLTLCLAILAVTGCGGTPQPPAKAEAPKAAQQELTYKVGMDATYAPWGFQDEKTKEIIGFDVDIIQAIGKDQHFKVELQNLAFDGLIPSLQSGNIDIAINDITINEERSKSVDFTKPYYIAGLGIMVKPDNNQFKTVKDLEGHVLGVSIGSTGAEEAAKIKNAQIRTYNTIVDAFLDLQNGSIEAVVNDKPTNEYYTARKGKGLAKSVDVHFDVEYLGIAVKKGNEEALKRCDTGLANIKKNGEYSKIYKKWFGVEPSPETLK